MALILKTDLSGLGLDFPVVADFVPGVPVAGLVEIWRSARNVTLESGAVAGWEGFNGSAAVQTIADRRPAYSDGLIKPDGVDDILLSNLAAPGGGSGYLVAKITAMADEGNLGIFVGSAVDSSNRIALGYRTTGEFSASIGSLSTTTFFGGSALVPDQEYVVGLYWAAGIAYLRVNGVQVATAAFAASGQTVGAAPLALGGYLNGANQAFQCPSWLHAVGIYSGTKTSDQLAAIDADMGAF